MRLLIASYYFPPAAGGGVQRVLAWARYLREFGIDVDVLAPDDPGWLQSDGGLVIPDHVTVHRTYNPSPHSIRPAHELAEASGMRRLARRAAMQPRRLLIPDIHVGWALAARAPARRVISERGIDVVLTTSPPRSAHLLGAHVARRTGTPWIADFRDSWLDLPHTRLDHRGVRGKQRIQVALASRTLAHASLITAVSEPLATDLRRRHPTVPVRVITNGIDLAHLDGLPAPPPLTCGADRADRFVITYTGNFFGRQSPAAFLDALALLLAREPDRASTLIARFVGSMQLWHETRIAGDRQLRSVVEHVEFQPYASVLAEQAAADALLLCVAPGRGSQGVYTGKVFEYVASRRPVLALVPEDNVARALLQRAGSGFSVDPEDVEAIASRLASLHDSWLQSGRMPDIDVPADVMVSISRREQTGELAGYVQSLATQGAVLPSRA